jgi:hypothetical protein
MTRCARILSFFTLLALSLLGCGATPQRTPVAPPTVPNAKAPRGPAVLDAQVTLPDSCAWLDVKSALPSNGGTPVALRIKGFCVHEEKASVASETYSYAEGAKTALAVRDVNERTLATRLKGTMLGPRGVEVRVDVWSSFTDVAYSTPHGSLAFKGTTLAELDAKIAGELADKIREELAATSTWMAEKQVSPGQGRPTSASEIVVSPRASGRAATTISEPFFQ